MLKRPQLRHTSLQGHHVRHVPFLFEESLKGDLKKQNELLRKVAEVAVRRYRNGFLKLIVYRYVRAVCNEYDRDSATLNPIETKSIPLEVLSPENAKHLQ